MIRESCQMLSTALRYYGVDAKQLYKTAYYNHPCTIWTRTSRTNFEWLVAHCKELLRLYIRLRGRIHGSAQVLFLCRMHSQVIPEGDLTPFANCTPYKDERYDNWSIHMKYRTFMVDKWRSDKKLPTWTYRNPPYWINDPLGGI